MPILISHSSVTLSEPSKESVISNTAGPASASSLYGHHPRCGEPGLDFADGGDDRRWLGFLAPCWHSVLCFLHYIPAACLDEITCTVQ